MGFRTMGCSLSESDGELRVFGFERPEGRGGCDGGGGRWLTIPFALAFNFFCLSSTARVSLCLFFEDWAAKEREMNDVFETDRVRPSSRSIFCSSPTFIANSGHGNFELSALEMPKVRFRSHFFRSVTSKRVVFLSPSNLQS